MPNTRVGQYRANVGYRAYGNALAQGVRTAYKNRQVIQDATQAVKRKVKQMWRPRKKKSTQETSNTVGQQYASGNDWTKSKRTVGRYKKPTLARLDKLVRAGMSRAIYRYQGITNFDTNAGFYRLSNAVNSADGTVYSPVHVYDLTSFPNVNASVAPARVMGWASAFAASDVYRGTMYSQVNTGASATSGEWRVESVGSLQQPLGVANYKVMHHDWSDIRINFYGPRKRTTRFDVIFARIPDTLATPLSAGTSNTALKELLRYVERPCIYSNLQSYDSNVAKKLKIVKQFSYWVSAGQTTDVDTTVGKIKEARIFMRHNRIYKMDWRHETGGTDIGHSQQDGDDWNNDVTSHDFPWHGSRLFMFIRAFSPERKTITTSGMSGYMSDAIDTNTEPSYDIIIRNAISTPA